MYICIYGFYEDVLTVRLLARMQYAHVTSVSLNIYKIDYTLSALKWKEKNILKYICVYGSHEDRQLYFCVMSYMHNGINWLDCHEAYVNQTSDYKNT